MSHLALMGLQVFLLSGTGSLEDGIQRSEWQSSFVIYFPVWPQGTWQRTRSFYPSLRVVWFPSQSVSIENPLYLYGEFGECRSSYWLGGKGYSLPDLQVRQHEIIQSYCKILVYKAHHVLLGPSIPGKLSAIFCWLKIESRSPLMDTALSKQLSACTLATSAFLRKPEREISVYSFIITTIMHWDYLGFLFFFSPPPHLPFLAGGRRGSLL